MASQVLLAIALVGVLLAGVTAYAMGMGMMGSQEDHGVNERGYVERAGSYSEEMMGMRSHEETGAGYGVETMPMMGYMGGYGYMHEECEEMMEEYGMEHEIGPEMSLVEIEGVVVGVDDYSDVLEVRVGNDIVYVKVVKMYVEPGTGYLVSGHWVFEAIEDALNETDSIKVKITGIETHEVVVALGIEVDGIGAYESPALFDKNN
ncbi:MAG: hypothetical protein F7C07_00615 [Desulfurococcales archaeon]|nr:hypothetical protein [Desulfurococcales archaeon]